MLALQALNIHLKYGNRTIIHQMSLSIEQGKIYTILGPNGSGKSTLIKALSRNLKPSSGTIELEGENVFSMKALEVAKRMALLHQKPQAPGDLSIRELVEHGRFPHRKFWSADASADNEKVDWALKQTRLTFMQDKKLQDLSGGEGQRAWLAMALAQSSKLLLLDEPTTFLDICHQLEMLELVKQLNREHGLTVVMILHDINQAAKYSDEIIVVHNGRLHSAGEPSHVITKDMLNEVFGVEAELKSGHQGQLIVEPIGIAEKNSGQVDSI
ncbi:ABC transporter ATP-binding protein [Paenibacillus sp. NPDC057967]|uniref:ABC transporter ATP-binding protein n=1 Tax=Paenibacillus sp. NPDC057967 TaxID=3346293 RepID=UPI0036D92A31